ncbi:MAG: hypothetical protein AB7K24_03500 [Gemmataceae bacterium]
MTTRKTTAAFRAAFVGEEYDATERPRRFVDRLSGVSIDILVTGRFPGSGKPGPLAFPDPEVVRERIDKYHVVNLPTLIELKLAAQRCRDGADVVELIRLQRKDFIECLEEKRREDEYETRED